MNQTFNLEEQVRRLTDRIEISELLFRFARALDTKDYAGYVALYAPDGILELPDPKGGPPIVLRRDEMANAIPRSLGRYAATHHLSCNHQIEISGDTAESHSYLQAVHVRRIPTDHWSAGGWYDCCYQRIDGDWRFSRIRLTAIWIAGEPGEIRPEA